MILTRLRVVVNENYGNTLFTSDISLHIARTLTFTEIITEKPEKHLNFWVGMLYTNSMAVKNLKPIRLAKGLTQKELAIRSGVNRGTIAYYETVESINPTHIQLRKIADVLGVAVEDLVAEAGKEKKHFIFDWRDRHPKYANIEIFQNVPAYIMERADIQRTIRANPNDNRLELIKLWEYLPSEQYRVTLLSLFYGDEDISKEFSAWEALFPSQINWEIRFCDVKPLMDETGRKIQPPGTPKRAPRPALKKSGKKKTVRAKKKTTTRKK